jgi:acyl-CoA synthetase (NDP forming)
MNPTEKESKRIFMSKSADQWIQLASGARREGRNTLSPKEIEAILSAYGIDMAKGAFSRPNLEEVLGAAGAIGFPVVLKLISQDLLHKSDAGVVRLNINNEEEVGRAYHEIVKNKERANPAAKIEGFLVQQMIRNGHEVIVGLGTDATFGKIIMFGMGGIFVEILRDVAIRKIPITRSDAQDMIEEIKGYRILRGARGGDSANFELIRKILMAVSRLGEEVGEITEMDLNPVIVSSREAVVADARIIVGRSRNGK